MIIHDDKERWTIIQLLYRQCEYYNNPHWDQGGPVRDAVWSWLMQASDKQISKAYDPFFHEWTEAMQQHKVPVNSDKPWGFSFVDSSWVIFENSMNC